MNVVGIVQEQHPDRAKLYRQWKKFDFPIYVDALNQLGLDVVPVPIAVDENGIIRSMKLKRENLSDFVEKDYPDVEMPSDYNVAANPEPEKKKKIARKQQKAEGWIEAGDAFFIKDDYDGAVRSYRNALENKKSGRAHFRLGVALRRRSEEGERSKSDAQESVRHWGKALAQEPNQYIWRRRLQQYGPRPDKPYNFYFWIEKARTEIEKRGEEPVKLSVEPRGSEVEPPSEKDRGKDGDTSIPDPDPEGKIHRDKEQLVQPEVVVTPSPVHPGDQVRVRVTFRLNPEKNPYWNNEAKPLTLSVDLPDKYRLREGRFVYPNQKKAETRGSRILEFEVTVPENAKKKTMTLSAYALYNVCKDREGVCLFLRHDFSIDIPVDPEAPRIK